jgi:8-oxo-dGTP pyrophosphatase MutT (NUDIX family)
MVHRFHSLSQTRNARLAGTGEKMTASEKKPAPPPPVIAAGGIVLRGRKKPLVAVVQMRQQKTWVLPKGKLHKNETVLAAAKREATEETGRDVVVYEYLGQIHYESGGLPKIAKFWRMEARGKPGKLMHDVQSVQWLPLNKAIAKLSRPRERKFLQRVGPKALAAAAHREARPSRLSRLIGWIGPGVKRLRFWRHLLLV